MNQPVRNHCDCCGLVINLQSGPDCPRCGYPVDPDAEEQFLKTNIRSLERVEAYGGANITVTNLTSRYQRRLNELLQMKRKMASSGIMNSDATREPEKSGVALGETQTKQNNSPVDPVQPVPVASNIGAAGEPVNAIPVPQQRVQTGHPFSLKAFFAEQAITIIASLGAFLVLIGSLSFVVNTPNFLLSFLIVFGVQALFGIVGVITFRFPDLHAVARIYTGIFALLVPIAGFASYGLIQGNYVHLSVPTLIALSAAYAAIIYAALAVYQRFVLFGYLGAIALVVADLAVAQVLNLASWWWPSLLMFLAIPALTSIAQSSAKNRLFFKGVSAVLHDPIRITMYLIVVVAILSSGLLTLNSLSEDVVGRSNNEMRFALLSILLLLLLWSSLALWLARRPERASVLVYIFLASVLAFCYAYNFSNTGYVVALTAVALLYHGLSRFVPQLLRLFGKLELHLDWVALGLVSVVPLVSQPLLPLQVIGKAYHSRWFTGLLQWDTEVIIALVALSLGCLVTISMALSRSSRAKKTKHTQHRNLCWVCLVCGFLLNCLYSVLVLLLNVEPVWYFLGFTLAIIAVTVVLRRSVRGTWADPLDLVVLIDMIVTLLLSLNQGVDYISNLLLFFAGLTYLILIYQRRAALLFVPASFAFLALLALPDRPRVLLIMGLLLPLAAVIVRRFISERRVSASNDPETQVRRPTMPWEWPLLAIGLLSGMMIALIDWYSPVSILQAWIHLSFPLAFEIATLSLVWYISAFLTRVRWWLLPVVGFAMVAIFFPGNAFWVMAVVTAIAAVLALGISRLAGRIWAAPLYTIAILSAITAGFTGPMQGQMTATTWVLLGFALLAYIIGLIEKLTIVLWIAPLFATWSVYYSASMNDFYRPPIVAITCAVLGVAIGSLNLLHLPVVRNLQKSRLMNYALPVYATALAAAILTGVYGTFSNINQPFYVCWVCLGFLFTLIAFVVLNIENQANLLWMVTGFAAWGTILAGQTTAYYVLGVGISAGILGLLSRSRSNWPWYTTMLLAAIMIGTWSFWQFAPPTTGFIGWGLLAFTLLGLIIMLVERSPELLVMPIAFAALTIYRWEPALDLAPMMAAYSLLFVLIFVSQFVWNVIAPARGIFSSTALHRFFGLVGQVIVILVIIGENGLSADAGNLVHVGAGSLLALAIMVYWYGRLQTRVTTQRLSTYTSGLLASLVVSWELVAFHQTSWSLLSLAPASYLIVVASMIMRDQTFSASTRKNLGQLAAVLGSVLLLLPTLWLSFSDSNTNLIYTLILLGESLALMVTGFVMRLRTYVLTGAGLVVIAALRTLFLPSLGISTPLAFLFTGILMIVVATVAATVFTNKQISHAWADWE